MKMPYSYELIEYFGAAPTESAPEDGYFLFVVELENGFDLFFSVNILECSLQIRLEINGNELCCICSEGCASVKIEGESLICQFDYGHFQSSCTLNFQKSPYFRWGTLRDFSFT